MSFDPTADQIADRYAESRNRVLGLAPPLSAEQMAIPVPGTPLWNVGELMSHLVGCAIELAAGNFEGAGSDPWTQAQVEARRGRSTAELLEEWDQGYADIDKEIRAGSIPAPIAFDVITHEQDLRGALGAERLSDPDALAYMTDGFGSRAVAIAAKSGLPPLELRDDSAGWAIGAGGGSCLSGTKFEIFRALTGRRSGAQVAAMSWTGDAAPYLGHLSPFGPLRDTDVSE